MARLLFVAAIALLACSCKEPEGIRTYTEAREAKVDGPYRMLGAMFPAEAPLWFFKLSGPSKNVGDSEKQFDEFLASITLGQGDALPLWKLPAGWTETGPKSIHAQTIRIPGTPPLELTITSAKGGVESNAGRWLDQLGRTKPSSPEGYQAYLKDIGTGANKGVRFSATGPKSPTMGMGAMGRMK